MIEAMTSNFLGHLNPEEDIYHHQGITSKRQGDNSYFYHYGVQKFINIKVAFINPRASIQLSLTRMLEEGSSAGLSLEAFSVFSFLSTEEFLSECYHNFCEMKLVILNISEAILQEEEVYSKICQIKLKLPDIPLIILADNNEPHFILKMFHHGVKGYILTTLSLPVMIQALRLIHAGGMFIPADSLMRLIPQEQPIQSEQPNGLKREVLKALTPRQVQVLQLLWRGKSNKVIARELGVQECTIKAHIGYIMEKLGATNRTHAVALASQLLAAEQNNPK